MSARMLKIDVIVFYSFYLGHTSPRKTRNNSGRLCLSTMEVVLAVKSTFTWQMDLGSPTPVTASYASGKRLRPSLSKQSLQLKTLALKKVTSWRRLDHLKREVVINQTLWKLVMIRSLVTLGRLEIIKFGIKDYNFGWSTPVHIKGIYLCRQ